MPVSDLGGLLRRGDSLGVVAALRDQRNPAFCGRLCAADPFSDPGVSAFSALVYFAAWPKRVDGQEAFRGQYGSRQGIRQAFSGAPRPSVNGPLSFFPWMCDGGIREPSGTEKVFPPVLRLERV